MAYNEAIAAATSNGALVWSIVTSIALALFATFKFKDGDSEAGAVAIGAAVLISLISFATDYYKAVWIAGAMLGFSILMLLTSYNEGIVQPLLFWTGSGLIISVILGYLIPLTISGMSAFVMPVLIIAGIMIVDVAIDRYSSTWELFLIFALAVIFAAILVCFFGVSHIWYGVAMMVSSVLLAFFGIYTKLIDPLFFAGFILWLDDVVGYSLVDPNPLLPVAFILGFTVTTIYILWRWLKE